jgi:hypothetical protein
LGNEIRRADERAWRHSGQYALGACQGDAAWKRLTAMRWERRWARRWARLSGKAHQAGQLLGHLGTVARNESTAALLTLDPQPQNHHVDVAACEHRRRVSRPFDSRRCFRSPCHSTRGSKTEFPTPPCHPHRSMWRRNVTRKFTHLSTAGRWRRSRTPATAPGPTTRPSPPPAAPPPP